MTNIYNQDIFKKLIHPYRKKLKVIEFLWQYDIAQWNSEGMVDYSYLECHIYVEMKNQLERISIGYIEYEPVNDKNYYEKIDNLAQDLGKFAETDYDVENYYPSKNTMDTSNISWLECQKLNGKDLKCTEKSNFDKKNYFNKLFEYFSKNKNIV